MILRARHSSLLSMLLLVAACLFTSTGFRVGQESRRAREHDTDEAHPPTGNPPSRFYEGTDGKKWENALIFESGDKPDVGTDVLREGLKERYPNQIVDLIVVDGSTFYEDASVEFDGENYGRAGEIKEQAVDLLTSQRSESGLPGTKTWLRYKLDKALRVALIMFKGETWSVQGIAALKEKDIASASWCEAGYIAVAPAAQGKGVGSTLWMALRAEAKAIGLQAIFTETVITNQGSLMMQRHHSKASLLIGLFTENFVDVKHPDRPPLEILTMLFPLRRSLLREKVELDRIIKEVVGLYEEKLKNAEMNTWIENKPKGSNDKFLSYDYVRTVVEEDPTVAYQYQSWSKRKADVDKQEETAGNEDTQSNRLRIVDISRLAKEKMRLLREGGNSTERKSFNDFVAKKICDELGI